MKFIKAQLVVILKDNKWLMVGERDHSPSRLISNNSAIPPPTPGFLSVTVQQRESQSHSSTQSSLIFSILVTTWL